MRDAAVKHVSGLAGKDAFDGAFAAAAERFPGHLPLLAARLEHLEKALAAEKGAAEGAAAGALAAFAEEVIGGIDAAALAQHFGVRREGESAAEKEAEREMALRRRVLVKALAARARAVRGGGGGDFEGAVAELRRWVEAKREVEFADLMLERARRAGRSGEALKVLTEVADHEDGAVCKAMAAKRARELRADLYRELGWAAIADHEAEAAVAANPPDLAPL